MLNMRTLRWLFPFCLAGFVAIAAALSQNTTAKPKAAPANEIRSALKAGPAILVIRPSDKPDTSEAYADWAGYLNDFAAKEKSLKIVKLTVSRYAELVKYPKLTGPYATLFVRDAADAWLYRDMILEPGIYVVGKTYLTSKSSQGPPADSGLTAVKLDLRP